MERFHSQSVKLSETLEHKLQQNKKKESLLVENKLLEKQLSDFQTAHMKEMGKRRQKRMREISCKAENQNLKNVQR